MVKCIMFDLGDVIVRNNPRRACMRLSKYCPVGVDEVEWFAPKKFHLLMDTGKLTKRQLYSAAVRNLKLEKVSQKKFEQIYADIFTDNPPVQDIARKLKKNYKLMLLSNTDAIHFEHMLRTFPILKIFEHHVVSYKVGYKKPHIKIFQAALKKCGHPARECIFIDDKKANILGAKKAGMKAIHYRSPSQLRADLRKLGVKL